MSQDASAGLLDDIAWEGENLATTLATDVRSAEDVDILRGAMVGDLDHQTSNAGLELNVIADLHSLSLYHASQDWSRQVPQSSCSVTRPQAVQCW